MSWLSYQRNLKNVLLDLDPRSSDLEALGGDSRRWLTYRRMVRSRFYETIDHAFERMCGFLGKDRFHRLVDQFFAEEPPRSPYLRDVPGELLRYVEGRHHALASAHALPPFALDLLRYEWAELDTAYSYQEVRASDVIPFDMHLPAVLSPAHRLLELEYPVHRMGAEGAEAPSEPEPVFLCLYRDPRTNEVETLELTAITARILAEIERRPAPLVEIVRAAAGREALSVDLEFVERLSTVLADLIERGVLLGSLVRVEET